MHRLSTALEVVRARAVTIVLCAAASLALAPHVLAAPAGDEPAPAGDEAAPAGDEAAPAGDADATDPAATTAEEPAAEEPAVSTERSLEASIRVIQPRPVLKNDRFELLLGGGLVATDTMYDHYFATATGRFHISEWVSIGATYAHYFSEASALLERVTRDYEVYPEISRVDWYAGADVSVMPIDGKFILFDSAIVYFEIYASIGGGVTKTSRSDDLHPTGMVGLGFRLFLADWLSFTVELRDHIFFEEFDAGTELVNNVVGLAGFSIFIPFGFDYTYPR